jgi:hypothetical protein
MRITQIVRTAGISLLCATAALVTFGTSIEINGTGKRVVAINVGDTAQANGWGRVAVEILKRRGWITVSESAMIKDLGYCSQRMHMDYAAKHNLNFEAFSYSVNTGIRQLGPREYYFSRR